MKRSREPHESDPGMEKKKRCATRWTTPKKEEQRSGSSSGVGFVTVGGVGGGGEKAAAFKREETTPCTKRIPTPHDPAPTAYLRELRRLTFEALVSMGSSN